LACISYPRNTLLNRDVRDRKKLERLATHLENSAGWSFESSPIYQFLKDVNVGTCPDTAGQPHSLLTKRPPAVPEHRGHGFIEDSVYHSKCKFLRAITGSEYYRVWSKPQQKFDGIFHDELDHELDYYVAEHPRFWITQDAWPCAVSLLTLSRDGKFQPHSGPVDMICLWLRPRRDQRFRRGLLTGPVISVVREPICIQNLHFPTDTAIVAAIAVAVFLPSNYMEHRNDSNRPEDTVHRGLHLCKNVYIVRAGGRNF